MRATFGESSFLAEWCSSGGRGAAGISSNISIYAFSGEQCFSGFGEVRHRCGGGEDDRSTYSNDLRKRRMLVPSKTKAIAAIAASCGHSTSKPTPLRNVPRITTR